MLQRIIAGILASCLGLLVWLSPAWASGKSTADVNARGIFDCFAPMEVEGKAVYCETSAVAAVGDYLYTASDKAIPGTSAVMTLTRQGTELTRSGYLEVPQMMALRKAEDFAVAPNQSWVFLSSGFDRALADDIKWDAYNTLLVWQPGQEDKAVVIEPTGEPETSLSLRPRLQRALTTEQFPAGAPYSKVEGLAMLPTYPYQLIFGIREIGAAYNDFNYTLQLVAADWNPTHPADVGNLNRIYTYTPKDHPQIDVDAGLSSLAWDPYHQQLLLLTSYEAEESDTGLGAYLWTLSLEELEQQTPPTLVTKEDGSPLVFAHKAEAVTVLSDQQLLVIHDDDRVLGDPDIQDPEHEFYREPHQAAYTLVDWRPKAPKSLGIRLITSNYR